MRRTPYESTAAPTLHSASDPAEFYVLCRSKSNLPNPIDSNAALLPYLLGSAHEWSGVWNGPKGLAIIIKIIMSFKVCIGYKQVQNSSSKTSIIKKGMLLPKLHNTNMLKLIFTI